MPFNKQYIFCKNVRNHFCLKYLKNATFEKQITSPWLSPGFVLTVSVTLKIERTALVTNSFAQYFEQTK